MGEWWYEALYWNNPIYAVQRSYDLFSQSWDVAFNDAPVEQADEVLQKGYQFTSGAITGSVGTLALIGIGAYLLLR